MENNKTNSRSAIVPPIDGEVTVTRRKMITTICCCYRQQVLLLVLMNVVGSVSSFAAKKASSKKAITPTTTSASSNNNKKGFGIPQQKTNNYMEIVSKFRKCLPSDNNVVCPCGSGMTYQQCCHKYHTGIEKASTPLLVLRSRYTAFQYRIVPYVIDTTHPSNRDYRSNKVTWAQELNRDGMFDSYDFISLYDIEIEQKDNDTNDATKNDDDVAYLQFKVRLRSKDNVMTIGGQETVVTERSRFIRMKDDTSNNDKENNNEENNDNNYYWLYAGGDVRSEIVGDAKLN